MIKILVRCLAALFIFILVLPYSSQAATVQSFKDVTSFKKEIEFLTSKEIIFGYPDGTFRPNEPIKRVHAVQMIMREMKPELGKAPNPNFKDIKPGDRGYEEVAKAVEMGIISGKGNNIFDPQGNLTRAEMAIILVRAYELGGIYPKGFTDVPMSSKAYWYISSLAASNITVGYPDGTFKPVQPINRAQFSAFMARIIEPSFQPKNVGIADTLLEALFDGDILDYDIDPVKPIVYLLDGSTNEVVALNYETYDAESVELDLPAERIAYANNKIYATQLKGKHDYYVPDKDQRGAFAVIDAATMKQDKVINIDLDPYDIEADDNGIVYISSGSGQHTKLVSFDSKTGEIISSQGIYARTLIEMHPSQKRLYTITTALSPRTMSSFAITNGALNEEQRSPYHGDYDLNKDLTISPDGKYIFNSTGHIFRSSATPSADMVYFAKLDRPYSSIAFDAEYGELYTANKKNYIQAYDYKTMKPIEQLETYGNVDKMFYIPKENILLIFSQVTLGGSTVPFTGLEKVYFEIEE
ncbi:S-layer homology domain-containing protein [Bacillus sp. B190/17]|uniref:S-layer homology domain-containing protein n=1 Tax=Bacillus lumedeiriae TaxID=3058829 RepID=A0ABW8I556_9BACI